ncbi:MAG: RNA polymerase sigma factor [Gemmatimonadota bacterium]
MRLSLLHPEPELPKTPVAHRTFEELLSDQLDPLYRTAVRLSGGNTADAEDLLQETALRGFERFHQLRDPSAGKSWLFTILTRTHLNRLRAARRSGEILFSDLGEAAWEEAMAAYTREGKDFSDTGVGHDLTMALDQLDPELRAAVTLVDLEGFRQREAAEMLDIAEGTVASRLFRARRALRRFLVLSGEKEARL